MKYTKMLGFYFFEAVGSFLNLGCSIFGFYPCVDLGVRFLVYCEGMRITQEKEAQSDKRKDQEAEAASLHKQAKDNG
tara:strand:- start:305 stop:535 length:231 start_codon:yes stop_codon:yes gene_type:complete